MAPAPSLEPADLFSVKGLVAVITGGGTGIGLMAARALESNGAKVYITGRRKDVLEKAAKDNAKHGNIIPLVGDVTSKEDLSRIVKFIEKDTGYINLLFANAGIGGPSVQGLFLPGREASIEEVQKVLWDTDPDEFNQTFEVNVAGVFFTVAAFLTLLDAGNKKGNVTQSSQIITTSSIGGFNRIPWAGYAYSATKAAVTHLTKQLASTLLTYKIRTNALAPGLYPSELTNAALEKMVDDPPKDLLPLGRPGNEEDMAGIILWLSGRAGAWISGNIVVTDGGRMSVIPTSY